jgi:phenylacetate-CoA ligase
MSLRNSFTENIVLPLIDQWQNQSIASSLKFLMESQHWSKADIEGYQNEKLKNLIVHSYNNVEYYNSLFKKLKLLPQDIQTKDDLQKLPILTKATIKQNIANGKLLASNIKRSTLLANSSSGSTGEPLQFFITPSSYSMNIATNLRGWYNMGYRLGDRYLKLSVNPRSSKLKQLQDNINNCIYFSSKGIDNIDIQRFISLVNKRNPKFLRGYPSTLSVIANYIIENNILIKGVKAVNTTGEILFPEMKKSIEKAFATRVFDSYNGEGGANMFQLNDDVYHIAHEYAITELINVEGSNIHEGIGEIITTDLWNYANPFLRYAVNDSVEVFQDPDSSKQMRATRILGRNVDMLKTPSGKTLIVHFFTGYFEWINSVTQFQIRQDTVRDFVLSLVVNNLFSPKDKEEIFNHVKNYIGQDANLIMDVVKTIPTQINGKTRFMLKNY